MKINLEQVTLRNEAWRRVLFTTPQQQLVLMYLPPGDTIPMEVHHAATQFIRIEAGTGVAIIGPTRHLLRPGDAVMIPPDTPHEIRAAPSGEGLSLYTLYAPPHHAPGLVQRVHPLED